MKCKCSLCGIEMESYTKRHEMKTSFGTEISVDEVHPWYHTGNKVVCQRCYNIIQQVFKKLETVTCVCCPQNGEYIDVTLCHECDYNWGHASTINGIYCGWRN